MSTATADEIDALLPQTQCAKCGYPGCRPYAEAIARGEAHINRCPPGGEAGVRKLAALLGVEFEPLDPACGPQMARSTAVIREELCIGCMLCIPACPVDAIVGAPKLMHTVLIESCTGCGLCIPPCPMDCVDMLTLDELARRGAPAAAREASTPVAAHAPRWRARYAAHMARTARERQRTPKPTAAPDASAARAVDTEESRKRTAVRAALERARARRASAG